MVSKYFELETDTEMFKTRTNAFIDKLVGRKVLIYGAGACFNLLYEKFKIKEKLNVVGISDKKFNTSEVDEFCGYRTIKTHCIEYEDFDVILITNEKSKPIVDYLKFDLKIPEEKFQPLFDNKKHDEAENYNFLMKYKFDKTLPKLIKKMHNKKVIIYGANSLLESITTYFDITGLDVVAVADKNFSNMNTNEEFLGYKAISPEQIEELNPDYVLVSEKYYIRIIEDLYYNILKKAKIKIKPLVSKSFITLFKEIQNNF